MRVVLLISIALSFSSVIAAEASAVPDEERKRIVVALVQQLQSDKFSVREKAEKDLKALHQQYLPELMAAFDASKDADVKHRATAILRAVRTRGDYLALQISLKDSKAVVALDDSHFMLRDADGLAALRTALDHYVEVRMERKDIELNEHGAIPWPVKLQIDDALIMKDVQRVVMELATRRFVNLQYETNTMKADIPLPPGGTHSEIVVPPEILALAEIGDALPDDEEGRKKILAAVPKLVRIRVHNQATEGAGFEIDGQILNEEKMVGHLKAVKKEKEHGGILLRVSYDENTAFKQVMKVFQAANEAKAKECGLVPIRGEE